MTETQRTKRNAAILKAMRAHSLRSRTEPGYAREFLIGTGIYDKNGNLTPAYGGKSAKGKTAA